jgi:hypothetical protein
MLMVLLLYQLCSFIYDMLSGESKLLVKHIYGGRRSEARYADGHALCPDVTLPAQGCARLYGDPRPYFRRQDACAILLGLGLEKLPGRQGDDPGSDALLLKQPACLQGYVDL